MWHWSLGLPAVLSTEGGRASLSERSASKDERYKASTRVRLILRAQFHVHPLAWSSDDVPLAHYENMGSWLEFHRQLKLSWHYSWSSRAFDEMMKILSDRGEAIESALHRVVPGGLPIGCLASFSTVGSWRLVAWLGSRFEAMLSYVGWCNHGNQAHPDERGR